MSDSDTQGFEMLCLLPGNSILDYRNIASRKISPDDMRPAKRG